ncbi:MAG: O-antigen translocase [Chlorobiaceae bacterium]|nr:O-antigen translocase [Chlorobiaceae bacterium]
MNDQKSSFRQIVKATSLFGGVQVFQIIISIVRAKIIAVLLGPAGMGISGLLTATTSLIAGLTGLGLGTSAIKNISAADASGDESRISTIVAVFRKLVWITGLLGAAVTLLLSPWLSEITFGNKNYTLAFVWLSVTLLFNQLSIGQSVLLQAMRKIQFLAKASMAGSFFGLLISAPLYYYWRIEAIVPALILSSALGLFLEWYYGRRIPVKKIDVSFSTILDEGRDMVQMGFMLTISGLITTAGSYIVRIFLSAEGGVAEVGLYNAGFAIINTYVGLVFSAMGTDYYPRLSGVSHDNGQANRLINQQSEVSILILAPVLSVFFIFINWVVVLMYSTKFVPVNGMIQWAALGMYFKAVSWSIAFILLAKGESKLFFWNELLANVYVLLFNLLGYKLAGLDGLGVSFLLGYAVYLIQVYLLARIKYNFSFDFGFYKIFVIQFLIGLLCFIAIRMLAVPWAYTVGLLLIALSSIYSYREMDKRMDLMQLITDMKSRFIKK